MTDTTNNKEIYKIVDEALAKITAQANALEAQQEQSINRFSPPQRTSQPLDAREKILDTDVATDREKMAGLNVLQQTGVAMLVQSNQNPSAALQLLDH